MLLYNLEQ